MPLKIATIAVAILSILTVLSPTAAARVALGQKCAPVDGVVPEVCATVTLVLQSEPASWCTNRGEPVPSGETCYSIEYDLVAHSILPGLSASGGGDHYAFGCPSPPQTEAPAAYSCTVGPFPLAAVSPHCDEVHGRAADLLFTTDLASTGRVCVT
ncbi:MAG: hypothetical protein QOE90_105 [Thermoplasmata archaeon]|jgi:hypothetical protein|nr:hypothetical protein [Thermoplasmata archaeon]